MRDAARFIKITIVLPALMASGMVRADRVATLERGDVDVYGNVGRGLSEALPEGGGLYPGDQVRAVRWPVLSFFRTVVGAPKIFAWLYNGATIAIPEKAESCQDKRVLFDLKDGTLEVGETHPHARQVSVKAGKPQIGKPRSIAPRTAMRPKTGRDVIRAAGACIAAIGTTFEVSVNPTGPSVPDNPGTTGVERTVRVLEGAAEFTNGGETVVVPEGYESQARGEGRPTRPTLITGRDADMILDWRYRPEDTLVWREGSAPAESRPAAPTASSGSRPSSLTDAAWTALMGHDPATAQRLAQQALEGGESFDARIALGLALLLQEDVEDAGDAFLKARDFDAARAPVARSWLALTYLAKDQWMEALAASRGAAAADDGSALVHGILAQVYLYTGDPDGALSEAQQAVLRAPQSPEAYIVLAQARLAQSDPKGARAAAETAVHYGGDRAEARFVQAAADPAVRERELKEALRLWPDYLPAARLLARVEIREGSGRRREAERLLRGLLARHPDSDELLATQAEVYYTAAQYSRSITALEAAVRLNASNGLYYAALSRALLDADQLNDAIDTGLEAVHLAPGIGQFHSILGLAYEFGGLTSQAELEYRAALATDEENALAHIELGLRTVDPSLRAGSISQAFLFEPAISTQLLRGGITTQVEAEIAGEDLRIPDPVDRKFGESGHFYDYDLVDRRIALNGDLHSLGFLGRGQERTVADLDGLIYQADRMATDASLYTTYSPNPRDRIFVGVTHTGLVQSSIDGGTVRTDSVATGLQVAIRHELGFGRYLWLGLAPTSEKEDAGSQVEEIAMGLRRHFLVSEARFDLMLSKRPRAASATVPAPAAPKAASGPLPGSSGAHPTWITLGAGYTPIHIRRLDNPFEEMIRKYDDGSKWIGYVQLNVLTRRGLSLSAQLRDETVRQTFSIADSSQPEQSILARSDNHLFGSLLASYTVDRHLICHLLVYRQSQDPLLLTTGLTGLEGEPGRIRSLFGVTQFALTPNEALLAVEGSALPAGVPGSTSLAEFSIDRYLSRASLLKLFLFHTVAEDLYLGDIPARVRRQGVGLRYERALSQRLFLNAIGALQGTAGHATGEQVSFAVGGIPYQPKTELRTDLRYIDPGGNKATLSLRYNSSFLYLPENTLMFQNPDEPLNIPVIRFRPHVYLDLGLAKEFGVRNELFLNISNLLNSPERDLREIGRVQRLVEFGYIHRF